MSLPVTVKWGKETVELKLDPAVMGVQGLKAELEKQTQVPGERMKVMAKSKGLWKGVLKDDIDMASFDWKNAADQKGGIQLLLMGSAAKLTGPKTKVVFLEDLPPEEMAKVQEPSGLVNLGNTCYLNSVVQCLRAAPQLRRGLEQFRPQNSQGAAIFLTSLRDTFRNLDRTADPVQPTALVQTTRLAFPQFAQRNAQGYPQQQDAEEFFSGLLSLAAPETKNEYIQYGLPNATSADLKGADNLADALFGLKMKETLTCDEIMEEEEAVVVSYDLLRKLVCNIQGGSDTASQVNINHVNEGIALSLSGTIEKHSELLGRDALWTRTQRIDRLPPLLCVQFGRFYWKATPDSQDHAGVKCKVMKPVAFSSDLDVYEFCTPDIQAVLKKARDKAIAEEEDRISKTLKGATEVTAMEETGHDDADMQESNADDDDDLQAALAMSMSNDVPIGPGLPADFQGQYELFAVVTHKGRDADGGHYMAWVKADHQGRVSKIADSNEDNEDWFVFDDDEVSPCKTEDVLKLKGGGDWHMSYLNFYRAMK